MVQVCMNPPKMTAELTESAVGYNSMTFTSNLTSPVQMTRAATTFGHTLTLLGT